MHRASQAVAIKDAMTTNASMTTAKAERALTGELTFFILPGPSGPALCRVAFHLFTREFYLFFIPLFLSSLILLYLFKFNARG
jgi:hypothetical protein